MVERRMRDNGGMMRHFLRMFCLLCGLLATVPVLAEQAERGSFIFTPPGRPPVTVWLAMPARNQTDTRIIFALHGMGRNAQGMREAWAGFAAREQVIVVAPEFDLAGYPKAAHYNLGNTRDDRGRPQPRSQWTFQTLEDLFIEVKARTGSQVTAYGVFGHSAGAQFAHRLLLSLPDAHVAWVISANAGYYVMPDASAAPYGMAASGMKDADACAAYGRPLRILLGGADNDPAHPQLHNSAQARAQGPHRVARGQAFHEATRAHAEKLRCPYRWSIEMVPGVAHESEKMARAAQTALRTWP